MGKIAASTPITIISKNTVPDNNASDNNASDNNASDNNASDNNASDNNASDNNASAGSFTQMNGFWILLLVIPTIFVNN
jgi:hypothetical protein